MLLVINVTVSYIMLYPNTNGWFYIPPVDIDSLVKSKNWLVDSLLFMLLKHHVSPFLMVKKRANVRFLGEDLSHSNPFSPMKCLVTCVQVCSNPETIQALAAGLDDPAEAEKWLSTEFLDGFKASRFRFCQTCVFFACGNGSKAMESQIWTNIRIYKLF